VSAVHRVGFVIGQLHRGGAEGQLRALASGLARDHGLAPHVYCLSDVVEPHGPALEREGIPVRSYRHRGWAGRSRPWSLRRDLAADAIDVVHAMLLGPTVHTALATALPGRAPHFVASYLSADQYRPWALRRIESWALRRAERIHVNSERGERFARDYYGVDAARLRVIPNGVAPADPAAVGRAEARRRLDLDAQAPVLVGVFRLSPEKNLDLFCRVAQEALGPDPAACCLVAGSGPLDAWLRRRVGSDRRFRLLGAVQDVPLLLAAADLLLLTSRNEGLPNVVLEAMAAGRPVVATRVGDLPQAVDSGRTGFLCEPNDAAGLIECCRALLADPRRAAELGAAARERVDRLYGMERMVAGFARLYDELAR